MSDRVVISCPECAQKLALQQQSVGRNARCPKCATVFDTGEAAVIELPRKKRGQPKRQSASSYRKKSKRKEPTLAPSPDDLFCDDETAVDNEWNDFDEGEGEDDWRDDDWRDGTS